MKRRIIGGLVASVVLVAATAAQADNIYVTVKGGKQVFKGEAAESKLKDKIVAIKFRYQVTSSSDLATGQQTGRRQHKPVVITKEWGAASPQLFQALVTNEVLPEVTIDFVGVNPSGEMALTHIIKLSNVRIVDITYTTEPASGPGKVGQRHLEDVSFIFQKIELEDKNGKTGATDSLVR